MKEFKTWYSEKKGKYILFFGFYLIFFGALGLYLRSANAIIPDEETEVETEITTYDISELINNDFEYSIEINDDYEIVNFHGTKNNIDYANYPNKYFLDIYNINQLLKRSKLAKSEKYVLTYELQNSEIDDILLTNSSDDYNEVFVYVKKDAKVESIVLNLTSYFNKEIYTITINYNMGEENENSPS